MLFVNEIKLPLGQNSEKAIEIAAKTARLRPSDAITGKIAKISVDARHKTPSLVYTVAFNIENEDKYLDKKSNNIVVKKEKILTFETPSKKLDKRPVICGFGPAGLFCGLLLAQKGFKPIILERGSDVDTRMEKINTFNNGGALDVDTNVQFGEGGAGTFSDGKLTTRIGDSLCGFVTKTFLEHGAPQEIAFKQKPHIGTDLLRDIIKNIRNEIIHLGGEVHFNTKLTEIITDNNKITGVKTTNGDFATDILILAMGHSARDTFYMLKDKGVTLNCKPFSVGFRVEHLQTTIDKGLYHDAAGHEDLPKGEYQLSCKSGNRGVYTFCMCPGGNVVASASSENTVVTNGMSYHARDGLNANAAVVVGVNENDFNGDAIKAIEFQESLEKKAFELTGGYKAPCQSVDLFLDNKPGVNIKSIKPTYPIGTVGADFTTLFGSELSNALRDGIRNFGRKIKGYDAKDVILTAPETRTSSPVRMPRDDKFMSTDIMGIYPSGEGAGYAGGIVSAAVDGVKVAKSIIDEYIPSEF